MKTFENGHDRRQPKTLRLTALGGLCSRRSWVQKLTLDLASGFVWGPLRDICLEGCN